jgi:hypothetical protein
MGARSEARHGFSSAERYGTISANYRVVTGIYDYWRIFRDMINPLTKVCVFGEDGTTIQGGAKLS